MSNLFSEFGHRFRLSRADRQPRRQSKTRYPAHRRSYFEAAAEKRAAEHL